MNPALMAQQSAADAEIVAFLCRSLDSDLCSVNRLHLKWKTAIGCWTTTESVPTEYYS